MIDPTPDYQSDDDQSLPEVPDFDLIRPIGKGGFGQVWLAVNRATGHLRAVKLISLRRSGASDPAGREINSIARLEENVHAHHPNLLEIHHVGKTAQHLFYVMDLADDVSGNPASLEADYRPASLQRRLENGPLPPQECLDYTRQLLTGLADLHEAGMIHRDVKPANCLFVRGELKLADFGLLAEANPQVSRVGTLRYMPPDGHMDTRADVYAVGLVIYEMLTGLPVVSFPRLGRRAREIAESPTLRGLNRLVLRACRADAQKRFPDAREMLEHLGSAGPKVGAGWLRSRRMLVAVTGCIVLASVVVAVWFRPQGPQPAPTLPGVDVNFVTEPFEATIYLDGRPLSRPDKTPYTTPCTVPDLPAKRYHLVFKRPGYADLDAGDVDFNKHRDIIARWRAALESDLPVHTPPP